MKVHRKKIRSKVSEKESIHKFGNEKYWHLNKKCNRCDNCSLDIVEEKIGGLENSPRTTYSMHVKCYDKLYERGVRRKSLWGKSKVLTHDTKCTFHKRKRNKVGFIIFQTFTLIKTQIRE